MLVKLTGRYIETTSVEYITRVYSKPNTNPTSYGFDVYFKGREKEFECRYEIKQYTAETKDSLLKKIENIRTKLAKKVSPEEIETLDSLIDLKK